MDGWMDGLRLMGGQSQVNGLMERWMEKKIYSWSDEWKDTHTGLSRFVHLMDDGWTRIHTVRVRVSVCACACMRLCVVRGRSVLIVHLKVNRVFVRPLHLRHLGNCLHIGPFSYHNTDSRSVLILLSSQKLTDHRATEVSLSLSLCEHWLSWQWSAVQAVTKPSIKAFGSFRVFLLRLGAAVNVFDSFLQLTNHTPCLKRN